MNLFGVNLDERPLIVAEIGVNHEGSEDAALKLIRLASEAGADAVKLQSYTPHRYTSASDKVRLERVTRFALSEAAHKRLAAEAEKLSIGFFSTPLTEDWVQILDGFCPLFKVASGDLTFEPIVRGTVATGKPVILSTGLATLEEIERAISWVQDEVGVVDLSERLILMQCVSAYPVPFEEANVRVLSNFRDRFNVRVGYSNHVDGPEACYAAVALGADVVEVHFTDCKTGREFRDHQLSFEPSDLEDLVKKLPNIRKSLGTGQKKRENSELENYPAIRKGLVATTTLPAGTVLKTSDVAFARPATEYASEDRDKLIGRTITETLAAGELIRRSSISE